jgi:ESS family glutamate:Na+ symporter
LVLTLLATVFIVPQNLLGVTMAGWSGMDPKAGRMTGSVSSSIWATRRSSIG